MAGVMIVTGAGRGIGAAIAAHGAKRGFKVAVNYSRSKDKAEAVVRQIKDAGGEAAAIQADMGVEADIVRLFKETDDKLGPVTALVNNAGVDLPAKNVAEITLKELQSIFAVNVFGAILCSREAINRMSTERGGRGGAIVHISSRASGHGNLVGEVPYTATKGAMDGMTLVMAKEVAKSGIRVNCIRPGLILTDIFDSTGGHEALRERAKTSVPIGRPGEPMEIATAAVWLCTEEASYVTGAILDVGGGR
jgi:NAD(P)-dependent dehydrogenase (short-subunit alcohol dehydrogenase family)